jgi:hypothetical protein
MTNAEHRLYLEVSEAIRIIMGDEKHGIGRGKYITNRAAEDPLAWWCAVEWIVEIAKRYDLAYKPRANNGR